MITAELANNGQVQPIYYNDMLVELNDVKTMCRHTYNQREITIATTSRLG